MSSSSGLWRCEACTFDNADAFREACEICATPRSAKRAKFNDSSAHEYSTASSKSNASNFAVELVCPYCGNDFWSQDLLEEHVFMHQQETEDDFQTHDISSGGFNEQYERSIMRAAKDGRISEQWAQEKLTELKTRDSRAEDSETRTQGLCTSLRTMLSKAPVSAKTRNFVVATDVGTPKPSSPQTTCTNNPFPKSKSTDFYSSSYGDRGWGCGYRNIQMLCSSLLKIPLMKTVLFGGLGHIPSVPCVQEYLEKAWADGFDAEGAGQLGSRVAGTKKWIGTTECVTLLRSFGINAVSVDFMSARSTEQQKPAQKHEKANGQQTLTSFFPGASGSDSSTKAGAKPKKQYKPNKELFDWLVKHFETQAQHHEALGTPILPVYLQHEGHSRTVVGFERAKGTQINLLIFDPSVWGKNLASEISAGKLQKIRRTIQGFTHKEYQVAFVRESDSLMSDADRRASKRITALERIISK